MGTSYKLSRTVALIVFLICKRVADEVNGPRHSEFTRSMTILSIWVEKKNCNTKEYVIVIVDGFTKYCHLTAVKDLTAKSASNALRHFVFLFGT